MPSSTPLEPKTLPLRDIHLPEAVSWWPPAPGWWLLLGLVILLAISVVYLWRRRTRSRYRRIALREIGEMSDLPPAELAAALSQLLRQAALCYFPRHDCAGLCGEEWLAFLDRPFADQPFSQGIGRSLLDAPYRKATLNDSEALIDLCRRWLKQLPMTVKNPGRGR